MGLSHTAGKRGQKAIGMNVREAPGAPMPAEPPPTFPAILAHSREGRFPNQNLFVTHPGLIHPRPNSCLCPMKKGLCVCLLMLLPQPGLLLPFSFLLSFALCAYRPHVYVLPAPLHLLPGASSLPSSGQIHHPHPPIIVFP